MFTQWHNEQRRSFWRVRFQVSPKETGYLYRKNRLETKLEPGVYDYFDYNGFLRLVTVPLTNRYLNVVNQEVLSKDNVALRFSYFIEYNIADPDTAIEKFDVFATSHNPFSQAEQIVHNLTQVHFRQIIAGIESEELNEKRREILPTVPENLTAELKSYGLRVERMQIRDLTFPKSIQDLFAKQLEAKIRARSDLENARTAVASARALKNASELMKGDENIKFIQYLETITKIAEKGKHTFVIENPTGKSVNLT